MSASTTQSVVRKQLCAMGCKLFEIGVLRMDGRMLLRSGWGSGQIAAALAWLRRENARGAQIFVRPHGTHALSLIDDLSVEAIARMTNAGFQPALVVETSPQNFQIWLNHGDILERNISSRAAKELAKRFGGDLSSADWRHFGRLAGFTNRKPERLLPNGFAPFVSLRRCEGTVYDAAGAFLEEVKSIADRAASPAEVSRTTFRPMLDGSLVQPLIEFHCSARYSGDLHRADMAWALHAASRGLSEQQITNEILHARDLSKKGRSHRQVSYAERTAYRALRTVESSH